MANICRDGGGGYATTAPLRGSSPFCGFLQAALRLRLRLHGETTIRRLRRRFGVWNMWNT